MDGVVITQIRVPAELHRKARNLAHEERRSFNSLVVAALEDLVRKTAR